MTIHSNAFSEPVLSPRDGSPAYMTGFENSFATETVVNALPLARNSPQKAPLGLYAEQLSGSAFTAPRHINKRTCFYRFRPSVQHGPGFLQVDAGLIRTAPCRGESDLPIAQMRWAPIVVPDEPCDFLSGLRTIATGTRRLRPSASRERWLLCSRLDIR